jgi:hypothetical protein
MLSASGTFRENPDSMFLFGAALNLARSGSFAVAPEVEEVLAPRGAYEHHRGRDGRLYTSKGMSYSVLLVPFVVAGDLLDGLHALPGEPGSMAMEMLGASMADPLLTAGQCLLLFDIALAFGFSRRACLVVTLVAGLGTILWADSKANGVEPLLGFLIAASYYGVVQFSRSGAARWAAWAGAAVGLLILAQPATAVLVAPVVAAYMVWSAWSVGTRRGVRMGLSATAYLVPVALSLALLGMMNAARWGSPTTTGYEWMAGWFSGPIYVGLYGLLFSAGASVFLYSPPLLLAFRAWRLAARPARELRRGLCTL